MLKGVFLLCAVLLVSSTSGNKGNFFLFHHFTVKGINQYLNNSLKNKCYDGD